MSQYQRGGRGRGGRGNWYGNQGRIWRGRGGHGAKPYGSSRGGHRGGNQGSKPIYATPGNFQQSVQLVQKTLYDQVTPYKGWTLYFPTELYSDQNPIVARTQAFEKYFMSWRGIFNFVDIENKGFFTVVFTDLLGDQIILEAIPELEKEISEMPETIISCMGLAMHQSIIQNLEKEIRESDEEVISTPCVKVGRIHCRLTDFEPVTPLKNLKANYYGKLVTVKGTVVRVSNIKPLCTQMAFECTGCGYVQALKLPDGKYIVPTSCSASECRSRTFRPKRSHPLTETIDGQTIRVQEIMDDDSRESGRIPRTVDCDLTNDLVDSSVPGDMVRVTGMVKVISTEEGRGRSKDKCMFLLYIHANSVTNAKGSKTANANTTAVEGMPGLAMEFTMKELYAIEEIQSEPNLFRLIVSSLCPSIYGHELVKAGLVLGLFGGSQKYSDEKNHIPVRGNPHILVVGDPGLGKSQMLQAVTNVAPRSVYVCGNATTTSGLTVTLSRDSGRGGGDFALEAGALVLADQGCCCIDEFDKMGSQHQALLEAMEQQSISIAKAGILCSLPARTSILAAANPVGGHYNKAKTVSENLRMGSALLSRFDLVFILLDKPDEELDIMLSDHVMAMHAGKKKNGNSSLLATPRSDITDESQLEWEMDKPLSERLKIPRGEQFDPLPAQLFRKYVGYAKKFVHPKITAEAAQVIQTFYLDLRRKHQNQDSTPITTRQLESLIRLAQARARLELREEVTEQDAKDVVEIMKYSMVDTFMDELGYLDFQRSQHGSGMSSRSRGKKLIATLQRISEQTCNTLFTVHDMKQIAKDAGINVPDFEEFVASLNNHGYLLKKGPRLYQLQTAGY